MKPLGASALLQKARQATKNGRVDVVRLANDLGINVFAVSKADPDYNAQIKYVSDRDQFEIFVNSRHPSTRQRFSIAHELSHYALDPDKIIARGSMDRPGTSTDTEEVKADSLAAKVLMPDDVIREYFESRRISTTSNFTPKDVEEIADYFYVSRAMAVQRLRAKGCQIPYLSFA